MAENIEPGPLHGYKNHISIQVTEKGPGKTYTMLKNKNEYKPASLDITDVLLQYRCAPTIQMCSYKTVSHVSLFSKALYLTW